MKCHVIFILTIFATLFCTIFSCISFKTHIDEDIKHQLEQNPRYIAERVRERKCILYVYMNFFDKYAKYKITYFDKLLNDIKKKLTKNEYDLFVTNDFKRCYNMAVIHRVNECVSYKYCSPAAMNSLLIEMATIDFESCIKEQNLKLGKPLNLESPLKSQSEFINEECLERYIKRIDPNENS
ncbi:hypothetical protein COBT_001903 [Conglomerata obtusa]